MGDILGIRPADLSFGLGIIGAIVGFVIAGPAGAKWGWFAGSTLGSLLSQENANNVVEGPRLTDFKAFNSKYGIPINRGYGNVRLGGNMVWAGPVTEVEEITVSCVTLPGGFAGMFTPKSCNTLVSYKYYQSAAIAFAEGPACAIPRLWADGQVVRDTRPATVKRAAVVTAKRYEDSPCRPERASPFRSYLGTATQQVDPTIYKHLGPEGSESGLDESIPFRHIVYLMVTELDLEAFGFKFPVISAEVSFGECTPYIFTQLDQSQLFVKNSQNIRITADQKGVVRGRLDLGFGTSPLGTSNRVMWNLRSGDLIFEASNTRDVPWTMMGASLAPVLEMNQNFDVVDGHFPFGNSFFASTSNFLSGLQSHVVRVDQPGALKTGRIGAHFYDEIRAGFWLQMAFGSSVFFFPTSQFPEAGHTGITEYEVTDAEGNVTTQTTTTQIPFSPTLGTTPTQTYLNDIFTLEEGTNPSMVWDEDPSNRSSNLYPDKECNVWSQTNASFLNNSYLSYIGGPESVKHVSILGFGVHIKFFDGVPVPSCSSLYCPTTDAIYFLAGASFNGTAGLYKVLRQEIFDVYQSGELLLPEHTDLERFLPTTTVDYGALVNGLSGGMLAFSSGGAGGMRFIDLHTLTPVEQYPDGIREFEMVNTEGVERVHPGFGSSAFIPHLEATWTSTFEMNWWRTEGEPVLLADIVVDLLTNTDGDERARLRPEDLDVSELTDLVKGFAIISQSPINSYIRQLQQAYLFDSVESDGKIKFPKRGRAITTELVEDELAAHNYDSSQEGILTPIVYERQSDVELPNELVVEYASFEDDYLKGTQRARRTSTPSDSNTTLTLAIVLDKDEAAQIADILLSEVWLTRMAPFTMMLGPRHMRIDPSDVIQVTMHDGVVHKLRVNQSMVGVNGMVELICSTEFTGLYTSNAVGVIDLKFDQEVPYNAVEPVMFDVTGRCLSSPNTLNQAGIVAGVGSTDRICSGGTFFTYNDLREKLLGFAAGPLTCACWGTVLHEIGHRNNYYPTDDRDDEIILYLSVLGGAIPESQTDEQALAGEQCIIVGHEIIGFTTVERLFTEETLVTGEDLTVYGDYPGPYRFVSTVTDFTQYLSSDETFWMQREATRDPWTKVAYYAAEVTPHEIIVQGFPTHPTGQSLQGLTALVPHAFILNGGVVNTVKLTGTYRGLFGTTTNMHHPMGEFFAFTGNLGFAPIDPVDVGYPLTGYALPTAGLTGQEPVRKSVKYEAANLRPWPVINVEGSGGNTLTWERQDKWYSHGIVYNALSPEENSEGGEAYEVWVIDGQTPGREGFVLHYHIVEVIPPATVPTAVVEGLTGTGFEEGKGRVVQIHQLTHYFETDDRMENNPEGPERGYIFRQIVSGDGLYRFGSPPSGASNFEAPATGDITYGPAYPTAEGQAPLTTERRWRHDPTTHFVEVPFRDSGGGVVFVAVAIRMPFSGAPYSPYPFVSQRALPSTPVTPARIDIGAKRTAITVVTQAKFYAGVDILNCSPSVDQEVVATLAFSNLSTNGPVSGIYMRGIGNSLAGNVDTSLFSSTVTDYFDSVGFDYEALNLDVVSSGQAEPTKTSFIGCGLGGANFDRFELYHILNDEVVVMDSIPYDHSSQMYAQRVFAVRFRIYKNRVQAKIWERTDPSFFDLGYQQTGIYLYDSPLKTDTVALENEPEEWMLDAYNDSEGPYFGGTGLWTRYGIAQLLYMRCAENGLTVD